MSRNRCSHQSELADAAKSPTAAQWHCVGSKQFNIRYFTGYFRYSTCCASPHSVLLRNPWKATAGFVSLLHPKLRGPSSSASSMSAPAEQPEREREREIWWERVRIGSASTYLQCGWEEMSHSIQIQDMFSNGHAQAMNGLKYDTMKFYDILLRYSDR